MTTIGFSLTVRLEKRQLQWNPGQANHRKLKITVDEDRQAPQFGRGKRENTKTASYEKGCQRSILWVDNQKHGRYCVQRGVRSNEVNEADDMAEGLEKPGKSIAVLAHLQLADDNSTPQSLPCVALLG